MNQLNLKLELDSEWFRSIPSIRLKLNDDILMSSEIREPTTIEKTLEVEDGKEYKLSIEFHNKSKFDTIIENGKIIKDTLIKIKKVEIDYVDITSSLFTNKEKFYYEHDNNGTSDTVLEPYYGVMGCNGSSVISFRSPFYEWLLETL